MPFDKNLDSRIEYTISKIQATYPEYSYDALRNLFYNKFSDKQISMFRGLWHSWKVDNQPVEGQIKNLLDTWI